MDQLKIALAVLKKHHFWILCTIVVLVGLGIWYGASDTLAKQYQERETKLVAQRKSVQDIVKSADPPNQVVIEAIHDAHKRLKEEVYRAWTLLYQVQKENNPWPHVLGEEFIEAAEALKPGENYLKPGEEFKPKDVKYLEWYQNYINEYLPQLGLIIDVREPRSMREWRLKGGKAREARRPIVKKKIEKKKPANAAEEKKAAEEPLEDELVGKVFWDENNELMIRQQFEWETRPTTLQVLIAQENLWVYEALLRIIRDTNEGSPSYYKCPVKHIYSLEIGREAAAAFAGGRTMGGMGGMMGGMPGMLGSGGMMGAGSGMYGPEGALGMAAGAMGPEAGAAAATPGSGGPTVSLDPQEIMARSLLDGRYVDQKGQPLAYGTEPPFPQFKMMPVRMVLLVDQRRIPKLLAQCANSSMPVEVKRVILRPDQVQSLNLGTPSTGAAAGMPGMAGSTMPGMPGAMPGMSGGAMPGMPGAMPGMGGPGRRMGSTPASSGAEAMYSGTMGGTRASIMPGMMGGMPGTSAGGEAETPWDMKVEIQGIIYIFNPPDRSKFDIAEAPFAGAKPDSGTGTSANGATPAAQPAEGPGKPPAGSPQPASDTPPDGAPAPEQPQPGDEGAKPPAAAPPAEAESAPEPAPKPASATN